MPARTLATAPRGYVMPPDQAPGFWQLGNLWRLMASGYQTGNSLCLIDQLVTPKGGGPCTHMHPSDEGLYVVSGHCTFNAGGASLSAAAGSLVVVPRFTEHAFSVDAPGTQLLNFYLPSGFEMFLIGFAHPAERNAAAPRRRGADGARTACRAVVARLRPDPGARIAGHRPAGSRVDEDEANARRGGAAVRRHGPDLARLVARRPALVGARRRRADRWQLLHVRHPGTPRDRRAAAPIRRGGCLLLRARRRDRRAARRPEEHRVSGRFHFVPRGTPHARRTTSETAHLLHLRHRRF